MRQNHSVWRHALLLTLTLWAADCGALGARAQDVRIRDLVAVLPEEPRLRINAGGHTGMVHALAFTGDSNRLCSAGDKVVHVWNLSALTRDLATVFLRERTMRWQVARGPLGQIYTLAYDAKGGLLALGGQAAMPPWGQIVLVEPKSGKLMHVLEGHQATLASLAFSPDGQWLASIDVTGEARLWRQGAWKPVVVLKPDTQQHGRDVAKAIEDRTGSYRSRFVAFAGNDRLVVPVYARQTAAGDLVWKLQHVDVAHAQQPFDLAPGGQTQEHIGMVTALAGSRFALRIASADMAAKDNVSLWDWPNQTLRVRRLDPGAVVSSLALSPDGRTLAVGTERPLSAGTGLPKAAGGPKLQLWDAETLQLKSSRDLPDVAAACAISDDGAQIAYGGGMNGEVFCGPVDGSQAPRALRGHGRRVWRVAFAAKDPPYRVAFGTELRFRGPNAYGDLSETFDTETSAVGRGSLEAADWIAPDYGSSDWTVERLSDGTLQLSRDGKAAGRIAFNLGSDLVEGHAQSWCFVPDRQGRPFAIAVGTTGQNSIYVFRLNDQPGQACPVLRHFRGHEDAVSSVGASLKSEYLVSGSVDGTVCFWSLADLEQGSTLYGSWGAELVLGAKGDLVAARVHPAGPLCGKGVREGDVLREIKWFEGDRESQQTQAEGMRKTLQSLPWGTQVYFRFSRGQALQPWFALRPAWQALATLFVGDDGEHAFWTPAGYYDASANGRSLFGWQVNPRTIQVLPQFYRADQFRTLEKPEVMRVLLRSGNLQDALLKSKVQPIVPLHETIPQQIARTPRVEVLTPNPDAEVPGQSAKVRARVHVPAGVKQVAVKVYASGVIATRRPKIEPGSDTLDGRQEIYEYEVPLPTEDRTLIQVLAGTEETVGAGEVVVRQPKPPKPASLPKLYVLAAGIEKFDDPDIPTLDGPVADARAVVKTLQDHAGKKVYEVEQPIVLTDRDVTPSKWREALRGLCAQIKDRARPDDLLVVFLAGHGICDRATGRYYFIGYHCRLAQTRSGPFTECIGWDDFRVLDGVPCRKLALLDTCHSGAIQPAAGNARSAARDLQDAMIFTITAARGDQVSLEEVQTRRGLFTKHLEAALSGLANLPALGGSGDGVVTVRETWAYVASEVPKDARKILNDAVARGRAQGQETQEPVAAPMELLPFTRHVPLTAVSDRKR